MNALGAGDIIADVTAHLVRAVVLVVCAMPLGANAGADWPQFLGPTRDGVYAGNDIADTWPKSGPKIAWRRDVGRGYSGPVVAGGKLFLFHRTGDREILECLNAETGEPIWSDGAPTSYVDDFGMDDGPRATPAVSGTRVYTFGAQGVLICRDVAIGKPIWSVDTTAKFAAPKGFFGLASSPLVEGDTVVVIVGGKPRAGVVGFDAATGAVKWTATDDEAGYASPVAATVDGKRRVFAFTAAGLNVLDPRDGSVVSSFGWRAPIRNSVNAATPLVIGGNTVFISASYETGAAFLRIKGATLERIWSGDNVLSNHYATCVLRDGWIFGFHGRQERGPSLRCAELSTGKLRWEEEIATAGTVTLAGDKLLVLTEKGELIIAPATADGFKPAGRAQILPFQCAAHPALAAGRLYARSKDKFVCVDLRGQP